MSVEDAISVMANHVNHVENHVEELGNGGEVMHVPPGEDISERLPSVTGGQGNDTCSEDNGDSELLARSKFMYDHVLPVCRVSHTF